ncbi:carboxypeptidase-like regulatory domain-containing protein [Sedimenticola thiotaurini]|uniref:Carboxypeptidase regulatory-like domain-containing protein n=1 Tax=Sedimenticola thiotaurini TaxID=1543721 RepID=A0A0F7JX15_9GAMM|nr:carboxypeptidase-like regulatory domain-containing protein [Sedimenticola thiotaurini]AKH19138.1 hypothetical protein AAY24_00900 [Sedimenticola thiotaurini]
MSRLCLIIPFLLLCNGVAEAHLLKLFAYVEGDRIHGSAYFAGGAGVADALVTISDADNQTVAELRTDPRGTFSYPVTSAGEYRLRVNTGEGHQAEWQIHSSEFAPAPVSSVTPPAATDHSPAPQSGSVTPPDTQLARLIEQAVARQIGPLREQLQRSDDRARLSDILGGIGFIFGLAGVALWWRARRGAPDR